MILNNHMQPYKTIIQLYLITKQNYYTEQPYLIIQNYLTRQPYKTIILKTILNNRTKLLYSRTVLNNHTKVSQ